MNPFEYFMALKPRIEHSPDIMSKLELYLHPQRSTLIAEGVLENAGYGLNHRHVRIGKIDDVWLATREFYTGLDSFDTRYEGEYYIESLVRHHENRDLTAAVCGGVYVRRQDRYFLIVEDLTRGGTSDFKPGLKGKPFGLLDGKKVWHDMDLQYIDKEESEMIYMLEDKMIIL